MVPVFRHVGIDLVLAYDDQVHALLDHRGQDIGPAGQHVADNFVRALQRQIGDLTRGQDRQTSDVEVLLVETPGHLPVLLADQAEGRFGGGDHPGCIEGDLRCRHGIGRSCLLPASGRKTGK